MSASRRIVVALLRVLVHAFFRRLEVVGAEHVPKDGGGLVVSWHPNGLVDPVLILSLFPRPVVFGARDGLFRVPVLGWLMRAIGTVPIKRAIDAGPGADAEARRAANRRALDALAGAVTSGSFAALFPEGVSHDAPHLAELKTGAARLYYQARASAGPDRPVVIVPVGLHYDEKRTFRSDALVCFHPPITLPPDLDAPATAEEPDESVRDRARRLTAEIERVLRDVVHATSDWEIHHLMHRARKLVRAERAHRAGADPGPTDVAERVLGFARVRAAYEERLRTHPDEVARLRARLAAYDADLRALRLEDHELDRPPRLASPWIGALLLLQVLATYLVLPPFLIVGYVVNLPPALLVLLAAKVGSKLEKDEATVKMVGGAIAFPATWALVGWLAAHGDRWLSTIFVDLPETPWLAASVAVLVSILGGAIALRYLRLARETWHALGVRLTRVQRTRQVARLRTERRDLCDALLAIAEGVALPGHLLPDGRVARA